MEIVTILWSSGAGVAVTLAGLCGLVWLIERRSPALILCVLGLATAASAFAELGMLNSATPEEFGAWQQWYHLPVFVAFVAMALFVHSYLGTGRRWLIRSFFAARSVVLVANFAVQPNFNFSKIENLRQMPLFGDQVSTIGVATTRGWQWFAVASMILLLAYLIDAAVQAWLKNAPDSRRKALAITFAVVVPLSANLIYAQLVVYGVIQAPISNVPWLLGALLVMGCELARDLILSARARLETAELRSKLAQAERVRIPGQLASALAHELAQPLNAISLNVDTARKHLTAAKPDVEELRAILDDIASDDRRAAETISRLRQLFPRRPIEIQPLAMDDAIQDVVALVRAEASAKHVVIDVRIEPGLPRVLGDRVHVSQVLFNLLMNALHAVESSPSNARRITVEARAGEAKSHIEIAISDSGPGIPEAIAEDIFKPFFSTTTDGMGIGLALSRSLVEAQGGHLWADHETPEGAMFRMTLQRA